MVKTSSKETYLDSKTDRSMRKTDFLKEIIKNVYSRRLLLKRAVNKRTFFRNKVEVNFYI